MTICAEKSACKTKQIKLFDVLLPARWHSQWSIWRHKKYIGIKTWLNMQSHACELDYALVMYCITNAFHSMHVCQTARRRGRIALLWPMVVRRAVLLTGVMSERKQSIWRNGHSHSPYSPRMSVWCMDFPVHRTIRRHTVPEELMQVSGSFFWSVWFQLFEARFT